MAIFRKKKKEEAKEEAAKIEQARQDVEAGLQTPQPPKESKAEKEEVVRIDPRNLLLLHRNGMQDLKKLETELKNYEVDYLYKISIVKKDLETIQQKLLDASYTKEQIGENADAALKELDRGQYSFLD